MSDLLLLGMENGLKYETIITTRNQVDEPNAAPIGVVCKDKDNIVLYLHEGSETVKNIAREKFFHVNITYDPLLFTQSTIGNPPLEEFQKDEQEDGFYLKSADAIFSARVTQEKTVETKDQFGTSQLAVVTAKVHEIIKTSQKMRPPLNRAIYGIIRALVYISRMDMAPPEKQKFYQEEIREISRVVNKVGGKDHKKAMKMIKEYLKK